MILAVDRAVARRVAGTDSRVLDRVMPGLSRLADHGVLWIVVSAGLRAIRDRRGARRAGGGAAGRGRPAPSTSWARACPPGPARRSLFPPAGGSRARPGRRRPHPV